MVDGHPAMRLGIGGLLGAAGDVWVVGETGDGKEALALAREAGPEVVILGLNLTGETDGIEVFRRLKAFAEPPRVLVHAAYDFADSVSSCLLAGADGYLHKSARCEDLLEAVRRAAAGEGVRRPGDGIGEPGARAAAPGAGRLTPKEREVLALMLRGCSNAEMTEKLYLGMPTVRTHVWSILRKLGAKNRKELLRPRSFEAVGF